MKRWNNVWEFWFPQYWCWGLWSGMLHYLAVVTDNDVSKELNFLKRWCLLPSLLSVTSRKTTIFNKRKPYCVFNDFATIAQCIASKVGTINGLQLGKDLEGRDHGLTVEIARNSCGTNWGNPRKLNQCSRCPSRHSNRVSLVEKLGHYRYRRLQITENCVTLVNFRRISVYTSV